MQEMRIWSLVWEDPSSETWVPTFQSLSSESCQSVNTSPEAWVQPLWDPLWVRRFKLLTSLFPRPCFLQHSSLGYLHLLHLLFSSPIAVEPFPVLYYLCWNMDFCFLGPFPGPCLEKKIELLKSSWKIFPNLTTWKSVYLHLKKDRPVKQPRGVTCPNHMPYSHGKENQASLAVGWIPWSTHLSAFICSLGIFPVHFPRDYWGFSTSSWWVCDRQGDLIREWEL